MGPFCSQTHLNSSGWSFYPGAGRGVGVTPVGSTAPAEPKLAGHPLDELLFTWATLQPSVSASDSAQTSSAFQNLCCLTDCSYLSFILVLYLLALEGVIRSSC